MNKECKPHAKEAGILDRGVEHIKSVPYGSQSGGCFTEYFRILHYAVGDNKIHLYREGRCNPMKRGAGKPIASPKGRRKPMPS